MRLVALCMLVALAGCGGGGGSAPAVTPTTGLVVNWVSLSGSSGGAGTQADPIHLAYPPLGVTVSATRRGVSQVFNLTADPNCQAVSVATAATTTVFSSGPPGAGSAVAFASGSSPVGPYDSSWTIVSSAKGACTVTLTTVEGVTANLQVYSEM
jgi:hypothetical protein